MQESAIGLYLHIPFCRRKCPYCDFYSLPAISNMQMQNYVQSLLCRIAAWSEKLERPVGSVYFGGGTPSSLPSDGIAAVLNAVRAQMTLLPDAEITLECNPSDIGGETPSFDLEQAVRAGVNRVSLGLQSASDAERSLLGRRGTVVQVTQAAARVRALGVRNLSLDLMLAIPGQTKESLRASVFYCAQQGATHVSAYLLKIEAGTPFSQKEQALRLPDEDEASDLYLYACEQLEEMGYSQYEISNFAKLGQESRHNLRYWNCEEYLGLGPAAHSFLDGKRFYYPRDLQSFLRGDMPLSDGRGGGFIEYAMLRLRLTQGLREDAVSNRFGHGIPARMRSLAQEYMQQGLLHTDTKRLALTREGFLLSNRLIATLLEEVDEDNLL